MSEFLSETEGCDLLARLFRARGYAIERNLLFREYGVEFHVDGWDAKARVGFEFLSSEDDDHDDLTVSEYQTLAAAQQRGELALFIIDEVEPLSAADLALSANEFLDEVSEAERSQRLVGVGRKKAAGGKKPAARKVSSAAGKMVTKKAAGKTVAGKKTVAAKKKAAVVTKARTGKKTAKKVAAKVAGSKVAEKLGKKVAGKKGPGKKATGKKARTSR
jgi:hypothetical protein